jgi:hypothetical protein
MRHRNEKSPRDGTAKSTEAVEWVGENGEPTKITPTHWYPVARDQYRLRADERTILAASSFIVILGAATLIATHFSAEVAAYVTRCAGHEVMRISEQKSRLANQGSRKSNLVAQRQVEADPARAPAEAQQATQARHIAAVSVPEAQQFLMEDRAEGWAQEPTEARRAIEGLDVQLQAEAARSARSLEEEREKAAALAQEVGVAGQAMTASAEQQHRALDEAQARAAAHASELAGTHREIETQAAQSQKAVDEAVQQKQMAERAIADLQPVKVAVTEPLKAAEAQGSAESAKLIARARVLLGQGNIGTARIVLERAAESGNAQASFMLAETYDPVILSGWGTYGTRGEVARAREHYAKAQTGGIREAKERLDALRQ